MGRKIKIGTRGSPLALVQAEIVKAKLLRVHPDFTPEDIEIIPILTTGDQVQDRKLIEIGGKGLFTKEIEEQILNGLVDFAVHSAKDMTTELPQGLALPIFLEREDVRDALISRNDTSLMDLPEGATIGTSSLRRQAQLLSVRPDFKIIALRGNLDTRLRKLKSEGMHAIILACAGLIRLGRYDQVTEALPVDIMLPAPAQGAIGLEVRENDREILEILGPLHHEPTGQAVAAERALLGVLDGSCRTPIAALATVEGKVLNITARILSPDGRDKYEIILEGAADEAKIVGVNIGQTLRRTVGEDVLERIKMEAQPEG